ncbi:MAG TPA: hypothetical protein VFQ52_11615, partial [Rhizomicrobium sp.]|nr:hypothetical protein [Rhizomicrobium sp.]
MIANSALYARRRAANYAFIALSLGAALFGLVWLSFILGGLLVDGFSALSFKLFTLPTPPPGSEGGLSNAIFGSVAMSLCAVVVGTPIGLFAGTYLAEYARHGRLAFVVRFVNDILLSAPSIITGLFIYEIVVAPMHHFSGWAGAASLTPDPSNRCRARSCRPTDMACRRIVRRLRRNRPRAHRAVQYVAPANNA